MKRKPKISIEEQLYRAGIWERPFRWTIVNLTDEMIGINISTGTARDGKITILPMEGDK